MKPPETRYAKSGETSIAYQAVGQGAFDLVFVPGFISNLELHWEDPGYARLLQRLAGFSRLIQLDKRGTGLSDRVDLRALPNLETRMDDVRAVMDAAGSGRAAILGASEGAPMAILFAAAYPERTRALVLYGGYANFHDWVMPKGQFARFLQTAATDWGNGSTLASFAPGRVHDAHFRAWWARFERLAASPAAAVALARMNAEIDVSGVLASIRVPTLLIHRSEDARVGPEASRFMAGRIAGARLVEIPGRDHPIWTSDIDRVADVIEEFLTGARPILHRERVLAALLAVRLVGVRQMAARLGDHGWRILEQRFRDACEQALRRFGGRSAAWLDNGLLARFDGPARAANCAGAIRDAARLLGTKVAQGLHVGEIEEADDAPRGLAVHMASAIADEARPGEILASSLVADLSAGSGLHFVSRGAIEVAGLAEPLRLLTLTVEQHLEPARNDAEAPPGTLSKRELEVIGLIARGMSNPAIASELQLSEHTVKRHVANILMKLDLPSRSAAAAFAARDA